MKSKTTSVMIPVLLMALLINLGLFTLLPNLRNSAPSFEEPLKVRSINMVRLEEVPPTPPKEQQVKPEAQDAPPKPRLDLPLDPSPAPTAQAPVFKIGPTLPELDTRFFEPTLGDVVFGESQLDKPISPSHNPAPIYPFKAKRMGIEGWVTVQFLVDEKGLVHELEVVDASPKNIFDKAILDAVSRWTFNPGEITGQAVKVRATKTYRFNLNR